jgi:hypothetical protein
MVRGVLVPFNFCPVLVLSLSVHATCLFGLFKQFVAPAIATELVAAVTKALTTSAPVATRTDFNMVNSLDTDCHLLSELHTEEVQTIIALRSIDLRSARSCQNQKRSIRAPSSLAAVLHWLP